MSRTRGGTRGSPQQVALNRSANSSGQASRGQVGGHEISIEGVLSGSAAGAMSAASVSASIKTTKGGSEAIVQAEAKICVRVGGVVRGDLGIGAEADIGVTYTDVSGDDSTTVASVTNSKYLNVAGYKISVVQSMRLDSKGNVVAVGVGVKGGRVLKGQLFDVGVETQTYAEQCWQAATDLTPRNETNQADTRRHDNSTSEGRREEKNSDKAQDSTKDRSGKGKAKEVRAPISKAESMQQKVKQNKESRQ